MTIKVRMFISFAFGILLVDILLYHWEIIPKIKLSSELHMLYLHVHLPTIET